MESQKFCVYNQTRESFLSLGVTAADLTLDRLRAMIERLTANADSGLWMVPYRGIPVARGLSPIDLLYLDKDYRVIQEVESFPTSSVEPLRDEVASALVLPAHTIYTSQTQPGDQLVICVADEMERRLEKLSNSFISVPAAPTAVSLSLVDTPPVKSNFEPPALRFRSTSSPSLFQGTGEMNQYELRTSRPNVLKAWLQNWLSADRRRSERVPLPGLVAYYWTGSTPRAYQISDISSTGLYLLTEERWYPGTMVLMTLQRTDSAGRNIDDAVAVQSKVVRWGSDGLGLAFVLPRAVDPDLSEVRYRTGADKKTLERFLNRLNERVV